MHIKSIAHLTVLSEKDIDHMKQFETSLVAGANSTDTNIKTPVLVRKSKTKL